MSAKPSSLAQIRRFVLAQPNRGRSSSRVQSKWNQLVRWIPALVWAGVIFLASADPVSADRSSRIIGPFVQWLFPDISEEALGTTVFYVRKLAHVTEYAVLSMLVWFALPRPKSAQSGRWPGRKALLTLIIVAAYAATDELHQTIVPTRQGNPVDVLIDTFGGAMGLMAVWIIGRWRKLW